VVEVSGKGRGGVGCGPGLSKLQSMRGEVADGEGRGNPIETEQSGKGFEQKGRPERDSAFRLLEVGGGAPSARGKKGGAHA